MAHRRARWHEIETAKRCYMTLPDGERVYYAVLGFAHIQTVDGPRPYAKISRGGSDAGLYPVSALVFVLPNGETVK